VDSLPTHPPEFQIEGVGASVRRKEDGRFLNGLGEYLGDIRVPNQSEVTFLRSPIAHGRIRAIEIPPEHVGKVFLASDIAFVKPIVAVGTAHGFKYSEYPVLATEKVRFVGDLIAMCIAPTRAEAEDIAQSINLDFEELPPIWDIDVALQTDGRVHENWTDNIFVETRVETGDLKAVRAKAAVTIEKKLRSARHAAVSLECRGVLAHYDRRLDEIVVYSSTQFPHVVRTGLAHLLGIADSKLRVIAPDVGGGFGVKNNLSPEEVAVTALSMKLHRPIRWIEDRREHLTASPHAREHRYDIKIHADDRGRILGLESTVMVDAGAYSVWPWTASMEAGMAMGIMTGPYDIPVYHGRAISVCTNKSPLGPYRGVGRTGACFAIETMIDAVAHKVGRDPVDVRIENMVPPSAMPYRSATDKVYDSGNYPECARRTVAAINLPKIRARQAKPEPDGKLIGFGMASYTEQTAHGVVEWASRGLPVVVGSEPALARMTPDGKLVLFVAIQSHGQGLETTLAQVAHQELSISLTDVTVRHGDTTSSPFGMGTFGSRSMTMAGGAVSDACIKLAEKIKRIGAHLLQAPRDAVRLAHGRVYFGEQCVSFADVGEAAYLRPERLPEGEDASLETSAIYQPERSTGAFSYATHACVVAVDPETGLVNLLDYVVCHDCGTMVNPLLVEAQVVGGVAQGLGTALYEEIPYDSNGQPLASTFLDYMIPGATEVPDVRVLHMETPSPHTRFGMKGMGEGGAIAPPAAVVNAINDALRPLNVSICETPATPDRIMEAIAAQLRTDRK
jgi:carbon-monoxide dehydrogenase large subunit